MRALEALVPTVIKILLPLFIKPHRAPLCSRTTLTQLQAAIMFTDPSVLKAQVSSPPAVALLLLDGPTACLYRVRA